MKVRTLSDPLVLLFRYSMPQLITSGISLDKLSSNRVDGLAVHAVVGSYAMRFLRD